VGRKLHRDLSSSHFEKLKKAVIVWLDSQAVDLSFNLLACQFFLRYRDKTTG